MLEWCVQMLLDHTHLSHKLARTTDASVCNQQPTWTQPGRHSSMDRRSVCLRDSEAGDAVVPYPWWSYSVSRWLHCWGSKKWSSLSLCGPMWLRKHFTFLPFSISEHPNAHRATEIWGNTLGRNISAKCVALNYHHSRRLLLNSNWAFHIRQM